MKKLLVLSLVAAMAIFGTNAFADVIGGFGAAVQAKSGAVDFDAKLIPNGGAFGISGAGGLAAGQTAGGVFNGTVGGEVSVIGGGTTDKDAYQFNPDIDADKKIGVGSSTHNNAITGGSLKLNVDGGKYLSIGGAEGTIGGVAGQASLDASGLGKSPKYFSKTDGFTGGIAGQGSIGAFEGAAYVISGPDYKERDRCKSYWVDSKAGAGMGAEIEMIGRSYSESYRFVDWNNGTKTEGMGTNVGAYTTVNSYGYDYDWDKGLAKAGAELDGGFAAAGGAATMTVQGNQYGTAKAIAVGAYKGHGSLDTNYEGSAVGYSSTSVTTIYGAKGSINSASAGMQVTSKISK